MQPINKSILMYPCVRPKIFTKYTYTVHYPAMATFWVPTGFRSGAEIINDGEHNSSNTNEYLLLQHVRAAVRAPMEEKFRDRFPSPEERIKKRIKKGHNSAYWWTYSFFKSE